MKRELFQNVLAIPCKSGDAVDRNGYLSAIVGIVVGSDAKMTLTVEHSDDGENFVPVTDKLVFPERPTEDGKFIFEAPVGAADEDGPVDTTGVVNVDVDLLGLKRFVKFTAAEEADDEPTKEGTKEGAKEGGETSTDESAVALVVVLGDAIAQPV